MIFYGTRSSNIKNGQLRNIKCPNCENETSMTYSVFGKYAHVYWIPFFPIGKTNIVECNDCKATYDVKDLDQKIKDKFKIEKEKESAKTPIWFFSGLIIIAIIAVAGYFLSQQTKAEELEFIDQPQVGDIYQYKTETNNYSTMKIDSVLKDSIYFFVNEMEITKSSGISEIDIEENYKELYGFSKSKIKEMYTNEEIYEINRD
jgi:hypothetical protein